MAPVPDKHKMDPPSATLTLSESDSETGELLRSWQKQSTAGTGTSLSRRRLTLFKKSLRVAPMFLIHTWSSVAAFVAMQPLLMEATCADDLGLPGEICNLLTAGNGSLKANFKTEETQLQVKVASLMFWRSIIQNIFPLFLVLLIGAWSDRHGRKVPMMAVLMAYIVQDLGLILCNEIRSTWATSSWSIILLTSLIPGLVGGDQSFAMVVFNHITDTSTDDERTFLNGCAMGFIFGGVAFGYMLGGLLASTLLTYTEIFLVTMAIEFCVLAYVYAYLEEEKKHVPVPEPDGTSGSSNFLLTLKSFGDLTLIRDTFLTIFKRRDGKLRMALFLLILAHICAQSPWMGELSVLYIFGKFKFSWDTETYGTFTATRYIIGFIGNWIAVTLLTKALRMPDSSVGITSCVSGLLGYLTFMLAPTTAWMYCGAIVAVFDSTMQVIPRSIMSKLVPSNEIGSVSSFLAVFDCIIGLTAGQAYSTLYTWTLGSFTSAFMGLSCSLMVPAVFIYVWFLRNKSELSKN